MAKEATKATQRRLQETGIPWGSIFSGSCIDVGCGDDPVRTIDWPGLTEVVTFDVEDGDAERLDELFPEGRFDVVHASQVLEHMTDPEDALRRWARVLKPGGHIVVTVPDVGAYENFTYPSLYNLDHKASFSMIYKGSPFPKHYRIPDLCALVQGILETVVARYVEENYDWGDRDRDQTWKAEDRVEIWNEMVFRKLALGG